MGVIWGVDHENRLLACGKCREKVENHLRKWREKIVKRVFRSPKSPSFHFWVNVPFKTHSLVLPVVYTDGSTSHGVTMIFWAISRTIPYWPLTSCVRTGFRVRWLDDQFFSRTILDAGQSSGLISGAEDLAVENFVNQLKNIFPIRQSMNIRLKIKLSTTEFNNSMGLKQCNKLT